MPAVFLISDTHFGHLGVCQFTQSDGVTKLRPWTDPAEMDEALIKNWNSVVRPQDKVYHLGDVVINRKALSTLARLNGEKVLIKGNHDIFRLEEYTPYFKDVRAYHKLDGMMLSHIPMHTDSLARFGCNVHGHLHSNRVMKPRGVSRGGDILYSKEIDPRYFSVCVEQIDFTPILLEDMIEKIIAQGGDIKLRDGRHSM